MRKERVQVLALIAMWVVGGLLALYFYVLGPFLKKRGQSEDELSTIEANIQKARQAMQGESKLRAEYEEAMDQLRATMTDIVVSPDSPLSWVTEKVYAVARGVGVDVRSINPVRLPDSAWEALVKAGRYLRPYGVQITLEASYAQVLDLIEAFERSNPFLCVNGVTIIGQDQNVTRHLVTLVVEWPMWGRPLGLQPFDENAGAPAAGGEPGSP